MSEGRSLLTEREREILRNGPESEEYSANRWYNVRHRVKERLGGVPEDLEVLEEHYPEIYAELIEILESESSEETGEEPLAA